MSHIKVLPVEATVSSDSFRKIEVEYFLWCRAYNYLSDKWRNDIQSETPSYTETLDWFKNHFPLRYEKLFREMECECVRTITY